MKRKKKIELYKKHLDKEFNGVFSFKDTKCFYKLLFETTTDNEGVIAFRYKGYDISYYGDNEYGEFTGGITLVKDNAEVLHASVSAPYDKKQLKEFVDLYIDKLQKLYNDIEK